MITRLLAALLALYIVAGAPKPGDLPVIGLLNGPNAPDASQSVLAKQALDFCLAHRETCANMAAGLAGGSLRTGTIAEPARAQEAQPLPQPAPELPLPPRRRG
jgi:hypothetical protein